MRVMRGFAGSNIQACYTEPIAATNEVDALNINAACNAPARSPKDYLGLVAFHSSFYLYELAVPMQTVTINHPQIDTATTTWQHGLGAKPDVVKFSVLGKAQEFQHTLFNHGLGYTPLVMVSYEETMVVAGTIVQSEAAGARFISVWANGGSVGLGECGYSSDLSLPAVSRTYKLLIFRTPAPNSALPLFSGNASSFQLGRGMVNSEKQYLRRQNGASPFNMDTARTLDISNGGARIGSGGVVKSDGFYNGGFSAPPYVPVGL